MAPPFLSPVYINALLNFKNDCKKLISKFKEAGKDFSDFADMFRAEKFGFIYVKHAESKYYYDFKEDTLQVAKYLMLNYNFVGGLYLLYALYYMQDNPKHAIRLEHSEFQKILEVIKEERHTLLETCQPGYIFTKLLHNDAFEFTYFSRSYSMEDNPRVRLVTKDEPIIVPEERKINKAEWLNKFLKEVDVEDELRKVDEEYFQIKSQLKEEHSELNLALDLVPDDTLGGLTKHLLKDKIIEDKVDIGTRRRLLKNRKLRRKKGYRNSKSFKVKDEDDIPDVPKKKKGIGCPRGRRKSYFRTVVNEPDDESSDSTNSVVSNDIKTELPSLY